MPDGGAGRLVIRSAVDTGAPNLRVSLVETLLRCFRELFESP